MDERDPIPAYGYSLAGFAKAGGFSLRTVKRLLERGYIDSVKIGNKRLIPVGEGARLIERARAERIDLTGGKPPPAKRTKPEFNSRTNSAPKPKRPISPRLKAHLDRLHGAKRAGK